MGCEFTYVAEAPTPAVFLIRPDDSPTSTRVAEMWETTPHMDIRQFRDLYGNPCTRLVLPTGRSTLRYESTFEVLDAVQDHDESAREIRPEDLPDDTLLYTLPSRFCQSDQLANEAWNRFGSIEPGYRRVQAICDHVHSHLTFQYGSTSSWSTAADVNATGFGVCRDFAHLAISFCRALNIPARYAFGYLPFIDIPADTDEMDFAAWMEVWLGDRWWTFDPRNNDLRKGRVLIGRGRDAADVAMATTFGGPWLANMTVRANEV